MTTRDARRLACWHAGRLLGDAMDQGWDLALIFPDPEHLQLFRLALVDLIHELSSRGKNVDHSVPYPPVCPADRRER